jgi:hypothetical protein
LDPSLHKIHLYKTFTSGSVVANLKSEKASRLANHFVMLQTSGSKSSHGYNRQTQMTCFSFINA